MDSKCWVPFCKWDRRFKKWGRRDHKHVLDYKLDKDGRIVPSCQGRFTWRHSGYHLICRKCGADGT